jgi:hypothetical protein
MCRDQAPENNIIKVSGVEGASHHTRSDVHIVGQRSDAATTQLPGQLQQFPRQCRLPHHPSPATERSHQSIDRRSGSQGRPRRSRNHGIVHRVGTSAFWNGRRIQGNGDATRLGCGRSPALDRSLQRHVV